MKKLIYLPLLSFLFAGVISCETDAELVEIPDSTIQRIADAAAAAVSTPSASEIASAVELALQDDLAAEEEVAPATITHSGLITSDETWSNTSIHLLNGRVIVPDGVRLTIQAGTVVKGIKSTDPTKASAILVARGGKLFAVGTAEHPIIMTSEDDPIKVDQTYDAGATKLTANDMALWGGLIVCGRAKISDKNNSGENRIEGIPATVSYGRYGGDNDNDNSGTMEYISLRHGGTVIGADNEINGVTFGGVGRETVFNNIEVFATKDDGIEFFGGTVNASNLLVWGQGDDAIDIDQAYAGTIDGALVILTAASDHGFEIDGPEGSATGRFTLKNVTVLGATFNCGALGVDGEMADFRKGATGDVLNILFSNFAGGKDVELDASADAATYSSGKLTFTNIDILHPLDADGNSCSNVESLSEIFDDKTDPTESTFESDSTTFAEIVTAKKDDSGVDESLFSWTFYAR